MTLTSTMPPILPDVNGRTKVVYWQYMSIMLNHTIVAARDKRESATFLTDLFGLPGAEPFGHFLVVNVANDVSLDYADVPAGDEIRPQHYAFLVSEDEFDSIYGKIHERGIAHWADPRQSRPGEINHNDGGRGVYFQDPAGHYLEIITRPYGSGGDPRLEEGHAVAAQTIEHLRPVAEDGHQFGCAAFHGRTTVAVTPADVGRP